MFPLPLHLMEVKLCKRMLSFAFLFFNFSKELFGIGNLFGYHTPKDFLNAVLYDECEQYAQML